MRNAGRPLSVSLRTDAATMADSLSRSAIDAPPMFTAVVPNVFASITRARVPPTDVRTISRSVCLFGVMGGGGGAGAFGNGGAAAGAAGGRTAGRATTAVAHVATQ